MLLTPATGRSRQTCPACACVIGATGQLHRCAVRRWVLRSVGARWSDLAACRGGLVCRGMLAGVVDRHHLTDRSFGWQSAKCGLTTCLKCVFLSPCMTPVSHVLAPQDDASVSGAPVRFVSHALDGGSKCVMTGAARATQVTAAAWPAVRPGQARFPNRGRGPSDHPATHHGPKIQDGQASLRPE